MYLPLAVVVCAAAFLMRILFPKGLNRAARFDMDMFLCRVGELVVFVRRGQITRVSGFKSQKSKVKRISEFPNFRCVAVLLYTRSTSEIKHKQARYHNTKKKC